jgi:gliding motility-associated-like protein
MKKLLIIILLVTAIKSGYAQCTPFQVLVSATDISCNGANDGSIVITSIGGQAPYQYFWGGPSSYSSSDSLIINLSTGTYSLTVVDANNCQSIPTFVVVNEPIYQLQFSTINVSCYGGATGNITANVTGGVQPISYAWSNTIQNTNYVDNLPIGDYSLTITDANGCQKSDTATINEPDSLNITIDIVNNVSCFSGSNGLISISPSGGTGAYSYFWQGPNNYVNPNPVNQLSNLIAGTYSISISDQNNCQTLRMINVSEPDEIFISTTQNNISCYEVNDGSISVSIIGGIPPYITNWNTSDTSLFLSNLTPSTYQLTVFDANNCNKQESVTISEPDSFTYNFQSVHVSCNALADASIDLEIVGGTLPYSYNWNNAYFTQDIASLVFGIYTLQLTDANNCSFTDSVEITQPLSLNTQVDSVLNVMCYADSSGFISISSFGGVAPYTYVWDDITTPDSIRMNLVANTYGANVIDQNNCTNSISITISESDEITIITTINNHLCFGDSAASILVDSIIGGVGGYNIVWENGDSLYYLNNLYQDSISLIITDNLQCANQLTLFLLSPDSLVVNFINNDISCFAVPDGSISAIVSGGAGGYSYLWSTTDTAQQIDSLAQGTYSVIVTDSNMCSITAQTGLSFPNPIISVISNNIPVSCYGGSNGLLEVNSSGGNPPYTYLWSNGENSTLNDSLISGIYSVITTDENGCTTQISEDVQQTTPFSISSQVNSPSCFDGNDGQIVVIVNGSTPPYTHSWSNGNTNNSVIGYVGYYTDTIYDANYCSIIHHDSIINTTPISISSTITDVSCFNGANGLINLGISGGNPPYSFSWNTGSAQNMLDSAATGLYFVQVTDANNCNVSDSFYVNQPLNAISSSFILFPTSCFNSIDGAINIQTNGGILPYQFLWSNGEITEDIQGIFAGSYSLLITDYNGCEFMDSFNLLSPDSIAITVAVDSISCNGNADGTASINIAGGISPYLVNWFNSATNTTIYNLQTGNYFVQVTDSNNCISQQQFSVFEPSTLTLSLQANDISCYGMSDGSILSVVNGGNGGYSYSWSNSDITATTDSLDVGIYSLTVVDVNNCSVIDYGIINQPNAMYVTINATDVNCNSGTDGMIDITISGGVLPYVFSWDNGSISEDLQNVSAGIYTVSILDNNNCLLSLSDTIEQPTSPILIEDSVVDVNCANGSNGSIVLDVSGGTPPFIYVWSSGQSTPSINQLLPSLYSILILDDNGCTANYSTIVGSTDPISSTSIILDESCLGALNGSIFLQLAGGIPPYSVVWQNGSSGEQLQNLGNGMYNATIYDSVNCIVVESYYVLAGSSFQIESSINNVKCFGESSASVILNITDGIPPFQVSWLDGYNQLIRDNLFADTYVVEITDSSGCMNTIQFDINEPDRLELELFGVEISCNSTYDGEIVTEISGGTTPYIYQWSNGLSQSSIYNLPAGNYMLIVSDSNNCIISDSIFLVANTNCFVIPTVFTPNGDGVNDNWTMQNLETNIIEMIQVIDENGLLLFESFSAESWDGTYNGILLQSNTYYYILRMQNGEYFTGAITLIR